MNKKYIVRLTDTERSVLEGLINTGKGAARTHARILLKADCGPDAPHWTDPAISATLGSCRYREPWRGMGKPRAEFYRRG